MRITTPRQKWIILFTLLQMLMLMVRLADSSRKAKLIMPTTWTIVIFLREMFSTQTQTRVDLIHLTGKPTRFQVRLKVSKATIQNKSQLESSESRESTRTSLSKTSGSCEDGGYLQAVPNPGPKFMTTASIDLSDPKSVEFEEADNLNYLPGSHLTESECSK